MRSLFVILAILQWGQGYAAQIYLLFGQDCGERIRYQRTVEDAPQMDYFSYSLPAGFGVRVLLETDAAGAIVSSRPPESALSCESFTLTEPQTDRINNGIDHLFLITPLPEGGYRQEPVLMAAILKEMNGSISYRSPLAAFSFDRENSVIGVDLGEGGEGAEVLFEGQQGSGCERSYLLRQHNPGTAYPYISYRMVPGLGVLERHLTGDGRFSKGESIAAVEVNGTSVSDYLQNNCEQVKPATTFVPLYIEPEPIAAVGPAVDQTVVPETKTIESAPSVTAPTSLPPATIHVVAPGETLYAISRRYGVTVAELQRANRLTGNTIRVGQELAIGNDYAAPSPAVPVPDTEEYTAPAPYDYYENTPASSQVVVPPAASQPVIVPAASSPPVEVPASDLPAPIDRPSYANTAEYHLVQAGETLASLARRYGYTTERFREFNNLGDAQVALVGQRLKTSHCSCPASESRPRPTATPAIDPPPTEYSNSYPAARPVVAPSQYRPIDGDPEEAEGSQSVSAPPAYGVPLQQERAVHTVKEGESLYGIARQYRMTVDELRELNELLPADVIVPFQRLYVN
ncbi:LysM repeat protein [Neolewinella xylanilytica]|uniref:LysM repeat protein n=1 Tax=Neolewinella xylanilytica TaxID=1514080 RepID=A0A2S6I0F5_9BACT|nr:LysM peptidoglycan-binding domain-containing protein [Neolewinella xylanilytica]PPK84247.1 LysM repeat protein [Neolewinella xylanilytica]